MYDLMVYGIFNNNNNSNDDETKALTVSHVSCFNFCICVYIVLT